VAFESFRDANQDGARAVRDWAKVRHKWPIPIRFDI
jgi:hypothetical protein